MTSKIASEDLTIIEISDLDESFDTISARIPKIVNELRSTHVWKGKLSEIDLKVPAIMTLFHTKTTSCILRHTKLICLFLYFNANVLITSNFSNPIS